ncbi:MAG: hypothetical protein H0X66_20995 [Verrucomicrobia bacterium]|nr:hypothetical protein [Verrucomicrobiota bacterium]
MNEPIFQNNGTRQIRFNPEVTLGNLLQLISMGAALITVWTSMDKRLSAVELREGYAIEERRDLKKSMEALTENQVLLTRTVDRISILMEQQKGETK